MPCVSALEIPQELDSDEDGLPDDFEINVSKTDPNSFSTDGDPYGDKEEYYHINMPSGMSPADHPLVAAYPNLNIYLENIDVIPKNEISTDTGKTKNSAWSINTETSNEEKNSVEVGAEIKTKIGGQDKFGMEITGHVNAIVEDTYITSKSKSQSGFTQEDWGTATTSDTDAAADLILTLHIKNSGTIAAYDIIPDINIWLGDKIIATFTSPTPIACLPPDAEIVYTANQGLVGTYPVDLTVSLDQLKSIDSGTPLSIDALQTKSKIKKFEKGWVLDDYSFYMGEINTRTATLKHRSKDGIYNEYKVYAARAEKSDGSSLLDSVTLGEAINLTIGNDILKSSDEGLDFGFFPREAFDESRKLIEKNESILNLKLKPGWQIFIKESGWVPSIEPPVIHWASITEENNQTYLSASVTDNLSSVNVIAHVKIKGIYQDIPMGSIDRDTIYKIILDEEIDEDGDHYINATNAEGYSARLKFSSPAKPILKNGNYLFNVKKNNLYMNADAGKNALQDYYKGGSDQIWVLTSNGAGFYSIKNSQNNLYLAGYENENIAIVQNLVSKYQWNIKPTDDGYWKIYNVNNKKYLTSAEDNSIILNEYGNTDGQKWAIQPAESFPNSNLLTLNLPVDYYLIIGEQSKYVFKPVYDPKHKDYFTDRIIQKWEIKPVGNGYFALFTTIKSNMVRPNVKEWPEVKRWLEVENLSQNAELKVVVNDSYQGKDSQKWYFKYVGKGCYNICSKVRSNNLTICLTEEAPEVKLEILHNHENQKWKVLPVTWVVIYDYITYSKKYLNFFIDLTNLEYPMESASSNGYELISLGEDIGTDIVAIMLPGIIYNEPPHIPGKLNISLLPSYFPLVGLESYTYEWKEKKKLIGIDALRKDEKMQKTILYPTVKSYSADFSRVMGLGGFPDISYLFKLGTGDERGAITCGNKYIQLIENQNYRKGLMPEAKDIIDNKTIEKFTFEHVTLL